MTNNTHGATPGKSTPNKKVTGGYETTTATVDNATNIIAHRRVLKANASLMRFSGGALLSAAIKSDKLNRITTAAPVNHPALTAQACRPFQRVDFLLINWLANGLGVKHGL